MVRDRPDPRAARHATGGQIRCKTPAGRWGEPGDLAGPVVFLASPASDFVTCTEPAVDRGYGVCDRVREC